MTPINGTQVIHVGTTESSPLHFGPGPVHLSTPSSETFHGFGPGPALVDGVELIGVASHFGHTAILA